MDSDPDPAIFINDLPDGKLKKKLFKFQVFEATFTLFFKDKKS
jgi:hypothetical protein